jgi:hypothetical protein
MRPEQRVTIWDDDQAAHLSRTVQLYGAPHPANLAIVGPEERDPWAATTPDILVVDTSPEADQRELGALLVRADWLLVPVKGPEGASIQVLPQFLRWTTDFDGCRLLGFVPTMYKPRRGDTQHWTNELFGLAETYHCAVFDPIPDWASISRFRNDGHPYAPLARAVLEKLDAG